MHAHFISTAFTFICLYMEIVAFGSNIIEILVYINTHLINIKDSCSAMSVCFSEQFITSLHFQNHC